MYFNAIDRLTESNAQLFREFKSRLKPASITLAVAISFGGQIFSLMLFGEYLSNPTSAGWKNWFWLIFMCLSLVGVFALLVVGTYLLTADLSKEEEKGTLNVIRLSPESAKNILIGKMLGVPIVLYLVAILALPLHCFSGLSGGIHPLSILGFYAVLISSCIFFYSLAFLFALLPIGQGNIKAGLFSGALVLVLLITCTIIASQPLPQNAFNWFVCFNPWLFIELVSRGDVYTGKLSLSWYQLNFSNNALIAGFFLIVNCAVWTNIIWRGLQRRFYKPGSNLFTKAQSYFITASWQIIVLGFVANPKANASQEAYWANFSFIMLLDLALYALLIISLTPSRQTVLDWARYRHYYKFGRQNQLWKDLVLGEKSPAVVAIGLNVLLASLILVPWVLGTSDFSFIVKALSGLGIAIALTSIFAIVAQFVSLAKNSKRNVWAAGSLVALAIAPPTFAIANYANVGHVSWIWLYSVFPWVWLYSPTIEPLAIISAFIIHWLGVTILSWQLQRRIKAMGASKLLTA